MAATLDQQAGDGALQHSRQPWFRRVSWGRVLAWATLILLIVITIFPFYWTLRTGLSNNRALPSNASSLLPADFTPPTELNWPDYVTGARGRRWTVSVDDVSPAERTRS
jgi:ABC-type glycerol-3-phosphate transport system permease component